MQSQLRTFKESKFVLFTITLMALVACDVNQKNEIPLSNFPHKWEALTTKNHKTFIFSPCNSQNDEFIIYKSDLNYDSVSKGDWVMTYVTGQDGISYSHLKLTKKDNSYQLKAKSGFDKNSKTITFNISNFDVIKQTSTWEWVDEYNKKQHFEMVTDKSAKSMPVVIEPASACWG
jgi:hypothetical protein